VRAYTTRPVTDDEIRVLLDAAVRAPSAMHAEPWAFVIVQDPALLNAISDRAKAGWLRPGPAPVSVTGERVTTFADLMRSPDASIFYDAGTLVVIGAKPLDRFVSADCWLAAENLMIAAVALGLGTCCIGSALAALDSPVAAIIVGEPAAAMPAAQRQPPDIQSWKRAPRS